MFGFFKKWVQSWKKSPTQLLEEKILALRRMGINAVIIRSTNTPAESFDQFLNFISQSKNSGLDWEYRRNELIHIEIERSRENKLVFLKFKLEAIYRSLK